MKMPLGISAEWASLGRLHDARANLQSIALIREWLDGVEAYLAAGGDPAKEPVIYGHDKSAATRGYTSAEYDGVTLILETKGYDELEGIKVQAAQRWVSAVNADGSRGEWRYALMHNMNEIPALLEDAAGLPVGVA